MSHINLNPSRLGIIKILDKMGANIKLKNIKNYNGEKCGDIHVKSTKNLKSIDIFFIDSTVLVLGIGDIENNYGHVWTELAARAYAVKISKINYQEKQ